MKHLLLSCIALLMGLTINAQTIYHTYWTADGVQHPLTITQQPSPVVHIPAEAVAVDLRDMGRTNTMLVIDAAQANPNCLYYLHANDPQPEGLDADTHNVVRGMQSETIRLDEDYDFFCPLTFNTAFISFLMKPTCEGSCGGYSKTLVLPFRPSEVMLYDVNGQPYTQQTSLLKILKYTGNAGNSLNIELVNSIRQMEAYQPYILGVYVGSRLLFMGEDTEVPTTREAVSQGSDYSMMGTTVSRQLPDTAYLYVPSENHFKQTATPSVLAPFRACMVVTTCPDVEAMPSGSTNGSDIDGAPDTDSPPFLFFSNSVWGADDNPNDKGNQTVFHRPNAQTRPNQTSVYSLSGQRLNSENLPNGLYILDGKKVLVRNGKKE